MKLNAKIIKGTGSFLTIALYGENKQPVGDILFSACHHQPPCHSGHALAQVRVFNGLLAVELVDYPEKKLPPYLKLN